MQRSLHLNTPNSSSTEWQHRFQWHWLLGAALFRQRHRPTYNRCHIVAVACISIAIGATCYFTIVTTVIFSLFNFNQCFENRYHIRKSQYIYELEISEPFDNLKNLRKNLTFYKVRVNYINIIGREDTEDGGKFTVEVSLHLNPDYHRNEIDPIQIFDNLPYVKSIKMQRLPHDCLDNNHH